MSFVRDNIINATKEDKCHPNSPFFLFFLFLKIIKTKIITTVRDKIIFSAI